jgi:glycosyltransferase involved in cell wall biosynthesis
MNIAIIIASYNRRNVLIQAVQSALRLQVPAGVNRQVVVMDDGSTDKTFEDLLSYRTLQLTEVADVETPFIRRAQSSSWPLTLLRSENGERGAARNKAALWCKKKFSSDWFLFLDSDDVLVESALLRFVQTLERQFSKDSVVLYSWYAIWNGKDSPTQLKQRFVIGPDGDASVAAIKDTFIALGASMIRAVAFFEVGMFPEDRQLSGSEDKILLTRLALAGPIQFCRQVAVWYRQHPNNTEPAIMLKSIELTEESLKKDIEKKFGVRSAEILKAMNRHSFFKRLGYMIFTRHLKTAFLLFFKAPVKDIFVLFRWKYWRLLLSFFCALLRSH